MLQAYFVRVSTHEGALFAQFAPGACSQIFKYRGAFCGVEILLPRMRYTHEIVGSHGGALLSERATGACSGSKISRVWSAFITCFELSREKLYRNELKGNKNYFELAGGSSYWVTEGKIIVNVRRKSRGNRLWFELSRVNWLCVCVRRFALANLKCQLQMH